MDVERERTGADGAISLSSSSRFRIRAQDRRMVRKRTSSEAGSTGEQVIARDLLDFARELVKVPSLSGEEARASALLADKLWKLGYRDVSIDEVGNVVAWFGRGPAKVMFNGHLDHVPPSGMERPYEGEIVDGGVWEEEGPALRGRGTCDMKANLAAGAFAVAFLAQRKLRGSYVFVADVQEELDSPQGIQKLLDEGLEADYGISGESTGLDVALGHRGKLQCELTIHGRSSHASSPEAGQNAVYAALPFLRALQSLPRTLPSDPVFGPGTATVTGVISEPQEGVAVVPHVCKVFVDRRYVPQESPQECYEALVALTSEVAAVTGVRADLRLLNVYPLMQTPSDHPIVATSTAAVESVTGRQPDLITWRFGVNATFMSAAGIPSVGLGPGNEKWAHTPEEHVSITELTQASQIYAEIVSEICQ
jgi:putative selenium metabolism hydrolase